MMRRVDSTLQILVAAAAAASDLSDSALSCDIGTEGDNLADVGLTVAASSSSSHPDSNLDFFYYYCHHLYFHCGTYVRQICCMSWQFIAGDECSLEISHQIIVGFKRGGGIVFSLLRLQIKIAASIV
jgi:hypothetical protein